MSGLHLIIGNKNYSSWSFRPWLAMKVAGIPFHETLSPFDEANHNRHFSEFSPSKKVPVLQHDDMTVWESLAILEYLADLYPDKHLWPEDTRRRAWARAISHEMHGGFGMLRSVCPMNMRRVPRAIQVCDTVKGDIARIESIWAECLEVSGGPFLFGSFCNADAMYAPIVNRLCIYELDGSETVQSYSEAMTALPAWEEWKQAAVAEPWIVEEDEV